MGSVLAVALSAVFLLVWASTSATLSGWTMAAITNATSQATTGSLAFTMSAGPCSLGPRVTGSVACAGTLSASDTITDNGTTPVAQLKASVTAASCGPVQFVNRMATTRPLLARYNPGFQAPDPWGGTNAITLDGASLATAAVAGAQPASTTQFGMGVWFKAAAGQQGPLLSMGSNPTATAGTDDHALVLNANGTVSFVLSGSTSKVTTATGTSYANGGWHYAYARFTQGLLGSSYTVSVDSTTPATGSNLLTYTNNTAYWHLGWAATSLTGAPTAFFTGALSNPTVFYTSAAPAPPSAAQRASQAAYNTWASAATDQWPLGDTGTTTFTGAQPTVGTSSPCTNVDVLWTLANPAGTVAAAGTRLSALANNVARTVPAPGPGVSQTSSFSTSLDAANSADVSAYVTGLRLYVPFAYVVSAVNGAWPLTFTWTSAGSVVIP